MGELVHLALRVGYLGDGFHGSQIQPDVVTVQGELQRVLRSLGWWKDDEHTMILGSRTDAGVNVRRNGGLLTLDRGLYQKIGDRKLVRAMADRLPDHLAVLDVTEVSSGWNPRLADHRVYRYRMEGMEGWWADDVDRFQRHLDLFVGTHDVRNFARMEEGKNPIRTVVSVAPWAVGGRTVGFEIVGHSFLWNQVRRIAMAVHQLETGRLTYEQVHDALHRPDLPADFGVAPAEWLVLWDVVWEALPAVAGPERTMAWQAPPTRAEGVERTMRRRWGAAASAEIEALLHHEWSALGRLHWS